MEYRHDFLIIGAGMAGASAAYFLADKGRCVILEAESQPGYHTTGRSAAFFAESYGGPTIAPLTIGSRNFLMAPPRGFVDAPLTHARGALHLFEPQDRDEAERRAADLSRQVKGIRLIDMDEVLAINPVIDRNRFAGAIADSGCMDLDVAGLHQGFLKGFRRKGGRVMVDASVSSLERRGGNWHAHSPVGEFVAPIVVNAAGAWGDHVAAMAGVEPVGLQPMRRTVIIFSPEGVAIGHNWPLTLDLDETFYFKPEAGKMLGSPADETPVAACDVQPEEIDIAVAADRIEKATSMTVSRIENKWAGLRTFAPDRTPVIGFDNDVPGFFWFVGQGGYGIQTAPAIARLTACRATGDAIGDDLLKAGVDPAVYEPRRLRDRRSGSTISLSGLQSTEG